MTTLRNFDNVAIVDWLGWLYVLLNGSTYSLPVVVENLMRFPLSNLWIDRPSLGEIILDRSKFAVS